MHSNSTIIPTLPHPQPGACYTPVVQGLSAVCYMASLLEQAKKEAALRAATIPASAAKTVGKVVVMLVDDDSDDRDLFKEVIEDLDAAIEVKAVEDGFKLMRTLNEPTAVLPTLIFLDLNMPGKNGKQCLAEIKTDSRLTDIPVVIYSTSVNKKDIQETHERGANLYISKPNTFRGLISVVEKVFSLDLDKLRRPPTMQDFVLSAEAT